MRRIGFGLLLILALGLLSPTPQPSLAGGRYCVQFGYDDSPSFVANPYAKTVREYQLGELPHPALNWFVGRNPTYSNLSPDGRYVAAIMTLPQTSNRALVIKDIQMETVFIASTVASPQFEELLWSHDGKKLARFGHVFHDDKFHLSITDITKRSSIERTIPVQPSELYEIFWSADDQYLALFGNNQVRFISFDKVEVIDKRLTNIGRNFAWSTVGHRYAVWQNQPESTELLVGTPEQGIEQQFRGNDGEIHWSPNDTYIASLSAPQNHELLEGQYYLNIFSLLDEKTWGNISGPSLAYTGVMRPLSVDIGWSADSSILIFSRPTTTSQLDAGFYPTEMELVAASPADEQIRVLAKSVMWNRPEAPTIRTVSGNRLAVPIVQNGKASVLLTDSDGSNQFLLKTTGPNLFDLSWSPDEKYFAYIAGIYLPNLPEDVKRPLPQSKLVWASADGHQEQSLSFENVHILGWQAEKGLLLYIAGNGDLNYVHALNPQTGKGFRLSGPVSAKIVEDTFLALWGGSWDFYTGPMGRAVVVVGRIDPSQWEGGFEWDDFNSFVYLAFWDKTKVRTLISNSYAVGHSVKDVVWSPDGLMFAFVNTDTNTSKALLKIYSAEGDLIWQYSYLVYNFRADLAWVPCGANK